MSRIRTSPSTLALAARQAKSDQSAAWLTFIYGALPDREYHRHGDEGQNVVPHNLPLDSYSAVMDTDHLLAERAAHPLNPDEEPLQRVENLMVITVIERLCRDGPLYEHIISVPGTSVSQPTSS